MDPRDELLADTQRLFTEVADRLTLEQSRQCQTNMVGFLRLLTEWQSSAENQTPSRNSDPTTSGQSTLSSHSQKARVPSLHTHERDRTTKR
jgi:hypothetical protein